jgi:hypothetical protein
MVLHIVAKSSELLLGITLRSEALENVKELS